MQQKIYKPQVRLLLSENKIPLHLSEDITNKINYLCQSINQVEWSGVLFYTTTGSIKENNLVVTVEDILPMDKGDTGFTSFAMDSRVIDYLIDNNAIERNLKMGLIHSHHNMSSFFSGTDNEELIDGAETNNIYVSLIVNNRGEKVAKVAQSLFLQGTIATKDEEGNDYEMPFSSLENSIKNVAVLAYDCVIHETKPQVSEDFIAKVKDIMQRPSHASSQRTMNNFTTYPSSYKTTSALPIKKFQDDWDDFDTPQVVHKKTFAPNFDEKEIVNVIKDGIDEYMGDCFGTEVLNVVDYRDPLASYIENYSPYYASIDEEDFKKFMTDHVLQATEDACIIDDSKMTVPRWTMAINYALKNIPQKEGFGKELKNILQTLLTKMQNGTKHTKS